MTAKFTAEHATHEICEECEHFIPFENHNSTEPASILAIGITLGICNNKNSNHFCHAITNFHEHCHLFENKVIKVDAVLL
jgi:hypothetical protein